MTTKDQTRVGFREVGEFLVVEGGFRVEGEFLVVEGGFRGVAEAVEVNRGAGEEVGAHLEEVGEGEAEG